jgi:hypothetical protein
MATRKLVSRKGTILGTITFPDHWVPRMEEYRGSAVRFHYESPEERASLRRFLAPATGHEIHLQRVAGIVQSWGMRDAVELLDITPEEFETMPGCSFAPGAAYMRSLIEGKP